MKVIVVTYLVAVGAIAAWAWAVDVSLLGSQREHLLPDVLLMICGVPTSLLLVPIYGTWPAQFDGLAQIVFLTTCALAQSGLLAVLAFRGIRSHVGRVATRPTGTSASSR